MDATRHIRPAAESDIPAFLPVLDAARRIMQHCIRKAGFRYCGIIHLANGDERLAYQMPVS